MALTSIAPVTYGQNDSTITPIISMTPTQVDISIQELLTTRYSTRRGIGEYIKFKLKIIAYL